MEEGKIIRKETIALLMWQKLHFFSFNSGIYVLGSFKCAYVGYCSNRKKAAEKKGSQI